jgi:hypothetical protein
MDVVLGPSVGPTLEKSTTSVHPSSPVVHYPNRKIKKIDGARRLLSFHSVPSMVLVGSPVESKGGGLRVPSRRYPPEGE